MDLINNLKNALNNKKVEKIPAISATSIAIFDTFNTSEVSWPQAHYDPKLMTKLGLSLYKQAKLENARIPFDMTSEAEAFGCKISSNSHSPPSIIEKAPIEYPENLDIPSDYTNKKRLAVISESIELLKNEYPEVPVIVGLVGPFTLAGHIIGIEKLVKMLNTESFTVETILDVVLDAQIELAKTYTNAGADVICIPDGSASPDLIQPEYFREYEKEALNELAKNIKCQSIIHMCGQSRPILEDLLEINFNGLSIEESINTGEARMVKEDLSSDTVIIGNISSTQTLLNKTTNEVKEEVKEILKHGTDILAPSCGIAPKTPLENIKAFVEARNEYYLEKN